jgi:hypothetical protein
MRPCAPALGLLAALSLGLLGCSWSRFSDDTNNAPVVLLQKPGKISGFGAALATTHDTSGAALLVAGSAGSLYNLGTGDSPGFDAIDITYCDPSSEQCSASIPLAGLPSALGPGTSVHSPRCFIGGAGSLGGKNGLIVRCSDAVEFVLPMPSAPAAQLSFDLSVQQPDDTSSVADSSADPSVLATGSTSRSVRDAWFYPPGLASIGSLTMPSDLAQALGTDASYGTTLAVMVVGGARIYAVGAPTSGDVLLWRSDGGTGSAFLGCLGGIPGFGRALASGKVNRDADDDLVLSDADNVHVLDGRVLGTLPETSASVCSFSALPAGALLGSFSCGSSKSLSDCASSSFGASLAVGDLDGDGDGEVIVGAPGMTVRGKHNAGALLVFDVERPSDTLFADAKFLSSAEEGDGLGTALCAPHLADRDVIAAAGPSSGKVALFYCSSLLALGKGGERCP